MLTKDAVEAAPWRYSPDQWQAVHGVHQPHIAEISPMQYAGLSGRAKRQYDATRAGEWDASMACKQAWRAAVVAAYVAGRFHWRDAGVSPEAKSTVIHHDLTQAALTRQQALDAMHEENARVTPADLTPGMWICSITHRWMRVITVYRVSVSLEWAPGDRITQHASVLRWVDYSDVARALDAGLSVRALHQQLTARMGWVGRDARADAGGGCYRMPGKKKKKGGGGC